MTNKNDKLPVYQGFYTPHDRSSDFDGTLTNPITGEVYTPPSMTKQSFVAECDVNNILRAFSPQGLAEVMNAARINGQYMDLPDPQDYQESLNTIIKAEAAFASLPSKIRNQFENSPTAFLAFVEDPANQDELIALGLATDNRPPPASPVQPIPPASPEPEIKPAKA